jgi:hypothetical protein
MVNCSNIVSFQASSGFKINKQGDYGVNFGMWKVRTSYKMGTRGSFPGVKQQEREADHSPPTSAEVKKIWFYTSILPYVFMA